jgi:ribonuclease HI
MHRTFVVYTDGGCSGNPGPGGWAFVIMEEGRELVARSGGEPQTTNNRMELTAVIEALDHIRRLSGTVGSIEINTDSQYVKNGITQWIHNWKRNGWRTASKDPVKNKEFWIALDALSSALPVTWKWVKGHAGIELNERCDSLVRQEMDKLI